MDYLQYYPGNSTSSDTNSYVPTIQPIRNQSSQWQHYSAVQHVKIHPSPDILIPSPIGATFGMSHTSSAATTICQHQTERSNVLALSVRDIIQRIKESSLRHANWLESHTSEIQKMSAKVKTIRRNLVHSTTDCITLNGGSVKSNDREDKMNSAAINDRDKQTHQRPSLVARVLSPSDVARVLSPSDVAHLSPSEFVSLVPALCALVTSSDINRNDDTIWGKDLCPGHDSAMPSLSLSPPIGIHISVNPLLSTSTLPPPVLKRLYTSSEVALAEWSSRLQARAFSNIHEGLCRHYASLPRSVLLVILSTLLDCCVLGTCCWSGQESSRYHTSHKSSSTAPSVPQRRISSLEVALKANNINPKEIYNLVEFIIKDCMIHT